MDPNDRRILGFWLPFVGFRDVEVPSDLVRRDRLRAGQRWAFVVQWMGVTLIQVFFAKARKPGN